jgi:wyosine [tRNA(Phe)-imidazoG37] synthetase (radical SAM superfamily)
LTGGGLLGFDGVIEDLMDADLIKVSVDGPNEALLQRMNRPAQGISFTKNIKGLKDLLDRFQGKVWTETMLVKGVNDEDESLYAFKNLFDEIGARIEKIHLNSPSRPSQGKYLKASSRKKLERFREIIGSKAMLVEDVIRNDLDGKLTATNMMFLN